MRKIYLILILFIFSVALPLSAQAGCCKASWSCSGSNGYVSKGDYFVPATAATECAAADNKLSGVLAARAKELKETLTSNGRMTTAIMMTAKMMTARMMISLTKT